MPRNSLETFDPFPVIMFINFERTFSPQCDCEKSLRLKSSLGNWAHYGCLKGMFCMVDTVTQCGKKQSLKPKVTPPL